jgi:hypothetical protein
MRDLVRALLLSALVIGPSAALGATEPPAVAAAAPTSVADVPAWDKEGQPPSGAELGFAPLSVTQSGVAYSPPAPAFDPARGDEPKIADLPAWASSYFATGPDRRQGPPGRFDVLGFGALPEPAAWALILIGTAMICGALRGLIMANRRLARLRDEDEAPD